MERPTSTPATNGALARPSSQSMASAPAVPKVTTGTSTAFISQEAENEDFGDGWADLEDDPADSWADDREKPSQAQTHAAPASSSSMPFDDGGEPDFEGWLNAQAQSKVQSKKPLPKGLAKKSIKPAKSALPPRSGTTTKSSAVTAATKASRPIDAKPSVEEDDDWGDAWG